MPSRTPRHLLPNGLGFQLTAASQPLPTPHRLHILFSHVYEEADPIVEFPAPPPKHFKMMCNLMVNGNRSKTDSKLSKSIVKACVEDGIHLAAAFGENGEVWNCVGESEAVRVGDIAHMYYGDLKKGKHFVGEVRSTYKKFSDSVWDFASESGFRHVKEVWPGCGGKRVIYCRVAWKEVAMTARDEYMIKYPGRNGFKVQGTILRIR